MVTEIRRVRPVDEPILANVAPDVFDGPIVPDRLAAFVSDPSHCLVVAIDGDLVVGQAAAIVHRHPDLPSELYVDNLGVTPSHRREGVGRRLLDALLAWGGEQGCEEAWVGTEHDNEPARALYASYSAEAEPFVLFFLTWPRPPERSRAPEK